jgi:hypothetical protein
MVLWVVERFERLNEPLQSACFLLPVKVPEMQDLDTRGMGQVGPARVDRWQREPFLRFDLPLSRFRSLAIFSVLSHGKWRRIRLEGEVLAIFWSLAVLQAYGRSSKGQRYGKMAQVQVC